MLKMLDGAMYRTTEKQHREFLRLCIEAETEPTKKLLVKSGAQEVADVKITDLSGLQPLAMAKELAGLTRPVSRKSRNGDKPAGDKPTRKAGTRKAGTRKAVAKSE